jgi:hypothetical protein
MKYRKSASKTDLFAADLNHHKLDQLDDPLLWIGACIDFTALVDGTTLRPEIPQGGSTLMPFWMTGISAQKYMRTEIIPVRSVKNKSRPKVIGDASNEKAVETIPSPNTSNSEANPNIRDNGPC